MGSERPKENFNIYSIKYLINNGVLRQHNGRKALSEKMEVEILIEEVMQPVFQ